MGPAKPSSGAPELPCLALNHSLSVLGHGDHLVCGRFLRAALEKRFASDSEHEGVIGVFVSTGAMGWIL